MNNMRCWDELSLRIEVVGYRRPCKFYPNEWPSRIRFRNLKVDSKWMCILKLWLYIVRVKPRVILGTSHLSNIILARVARLPWMHSLFVGSFHSDPLGCSRDVSERKRKRRLSEMRKEYPHLDGLIVVSNGLKERFAHEVGIKHVSVRVIYNGVVTHEMERSAKKAASHPWLKRKDRFVVVSAGGLRAVKDYAMLLTAFARLTHWTPSRLVIIGEGKERQRLESRAKELGIEDDVNMPGYVDDPYPWIARADLFVLSSRSEGMSMVVAEALALGVPVVSTDCPSGPREILGGGRYGMLVPIGEPAEMAEAMHQVLTRRWVADVPASAVDPFRDGYSAREHVRFFRDLGGLPE